LTEQLQRIMGRGVEIDLSDMPENRSGTIDTRLRAAHLSLLNFVHMIPIDAFAPVPVNEREKIVDM
jgi:hypothetical protein